MREIVATPVVMQGIMMATVVCAEVKQYFELATFLQFVTFVESGYSSQIPQNTLQDEQAGSNLMKGMVCIYTERLKDNIIYKLMDFQEIDANPCLFSLYKGVMSGIKMLCDQVRSYLLGEYAELLENSEQSY